VAHALGLGHPARECKRAAISAGGAASLIYIILLIGHNKPGIERGAKWPAARHLSNDALPALKEINSGGSG
jgi:hypothetical protein